MLEAVPCVLFSAQNGGGPHAKRVLDPVRAVPDMSQQPQHSKGSIPVSATLYTCWHAYLIRAHLVWCVYVCRPVTALTLSLVLGSCGLIFATHAGLCAHPRLPCKRPGVLASWAFEPRARTGSPACSVPPSTLYGTLSRTVSRSRTNLSRLCGLVSS